MMKFLSLTDKKSLGEGDNVNLEIQVQRTARLRFFFLLFGLPYKLTLRHLVCPHVD